MRRGVAPLGGGAGLSHVLHHDVASGEAADQERSLVADHGPHPVFRAQRIGRGTGTGFLTDAEVNTAHHFALLVKILEGRLHAAVQEHPAVDLDALLFVEVFRFAEGRNWGAQIAGHFVMHVPSGAYLLQCEAWPFQPIIDNRVGALI